MVNRFNADERPQFLFRFANSARDDALQLGLARGDDHPGPRAITYVLLNYGDASFSEVRAGSAQITRLAGNAGGWLVSGRFALSLGGSSMASGQPRQREVEVQDGDFENLPCIEADKPGRG